MTDNNNENKKKINILSLDGGGIRGLYELFILQKLDKAIKAEGGDKNKSIVDYFDLVAGTSTGGIIALALGLGGKSIEFVIDLYLELASNIFAKKAESWSQKVKSFVENSWKGYSSGFANGYYDTNILEDLLEKNFKDIPNEYMFQYGDQDRKVFVVASRSDTSEWGPYVIRSYQHQNLTGSTSHQKLWAEGTDKETYWKVWQAARATSAAPTYFDEFTIADESKKNSKKFVDGGLCANNPTELAIYESVMLWGETQRTLGLVLSLGTGTTTPKHDEVPSILRFGNKVQNLLTESQLTHHNVQRHRQTMKFWSKGSPYAYCRMDPPEGARFSLDAHNQIGAIIKHVEDWLNSENWIHLKNQVIKELKDQGLIASPSSSSK